MTDTPRVTEILEIVSETPSHKTFRFRDAGIATAKPGQFLMVWLPGVDEIPMGVAEAGEVSAITVEKLGDCTTKLHELNVGDKIGIRGPYGNGFSLPKESSNLLMIAGGTGAVPILPTVERALEAGHSVTLIHGSRCEDLLLYAERFERMDIGYHKCTDDGSCGMKGFTTDVAEKLLDTGGYDAIYTCGPEVMMKKVVALGLKHDVPTYASLERYMKCGVGVCDQCSIGAGLRVCKDGPVFDGETLGQVADFGIFKREASGKRINL
ncbi:MAG: dihydroorotate dehydrogenase electron transfer subunit [Thermoplasmata archaeon HGW-Thermoplasmata-1]|nr:MAG: dihydroorotate dehydrogenase electron transfer subunit [Thermoplasmata archaeon HGW-Thermoplasmata-1]